MTDTYRKVSRLIKKILVGETCLNSVCWYKQGTISRHRW